MLPTAANSPKRRILRRWRNRIRHKLPQSRQKRWLLYGAILAILHFLVGYGQRDLRRALPSVFGEIDEPPTYKQLRQWEMDLPQHNLDLPFPEGGHGKYVYFRNQVRKLGWNNVLNEV